MKSNSYHLEISVILRIPGGFFRAFGRQVCDFLNLGMEKVIQWMIQHPQEVFNSLRLAWTIFKRVRTRIKRKQKSQDNSCPGNQSDNNTCMPHPIPPVSESSKTD